MNFKNKVDYVVKAFDFYDDYNDPKAVLKSLLYVVFEQDYELAERAKQHHMNLKTENNVWFCKEDGSKVRVICTDRKYPAPIVLLRTEYYNGVKEEYIDKLTMKELHEKYTQEP